MEPRHCALWNRCMESLQPLQPLLQNIAKQGKQDYTAKEAGRTTTRMLNVGGIADAVVARQKREEYMQALWDSIPVVPHRDTQPRGKKRDSQGKPSVGAVRTDDQEQRKDHIKRRLRRKWTRRR